jgi:hypothetical protein
MKKLLAIVLLTLCAFAEGVAGHWDLSVDTPHGAMKGALELKLDGSNVTGSMELPAMGTFPVKGNLDGAKIVFDLQLPDNQGSLKFTGTVAGNKISGTSEHGGWTATR